MSGAESPTDTINSTKQSKSKSKDDVSNRDLMDTLLSMKQAASDTNNKWNEYTSQNDDRILKIEEQAASTTQKLYELSSQIDTLEASQQTLFEQQEKWKQQQLQNNITIMGIPPFENEDLLGVVADIGVKFDLNIKESDVASINRVIGSKNHIIIVRFFNFNTKMAIMQKARRIDVFSSDVFSDVEPNAEHNNQLFINHHLTPHCAKLLQYGKEEIKNGLLHSCWVSSSGLLVRCNENDTPRSFMLLENLRSFIHSRQPDDSIAEARDQPSTSKKLKTSDVEIGSNSNLSIRRRGNSNNGFRNGSKNGRVKSKQMKKQQQRSNSTVMKEPGKRKVGDTSLDSSIESDTQRKPNQSAKSKRLI